MTNSGARKFTFYFCCHCWKSACCKSCKINYVKSENQWTHKYGCSPCQNAIFTMLSRKSCCDQSSATLCSAGSTPAGISWPSPFWQFFICFKKNYWKASKHQGQIIPITHNWKWPLWTRPSHRWKSAVFCSRKKTALLGVVCEFSNALISRVPGPITI